MSSTRHADTGSPFRQERYASSPSLVRGLLGNLVAARCRKLASIEDRALIWNLQRASWQPDGLATIAAGLIAMFPGRVLSPSMQKHGCKPDQIYDAKKVEAVHADFYNPKTGNMDGIISVGEDEKGESYVATPAAALADECRRIASYKLEIALADLCLNPAIDPARFSPPFFPGLIATLREVQAAAIVISGASHVVTEIGRQVFETLNYCQQTSSMVLIDGSARIGKTHAAKIWCDLHPGRARYMQVPSGNDDAGFFKAIAKSLGVSVSRNSKAIELRDRCEDVLQGSGLLLVLDEAHYCFKQGDSRYDLTSRINWIMTALVNHGVPVALVTTPQFMRSQKSVETKSSWTSEQFTGRIGHYQKLPDSLSKEDLSAVAKHYLPEGCPKSIEALVLYAQGSAKYLAAIDAIVRRAFYLAAKSKRQNVVFLDIRNAIKESVIPSDNALHAALTAPKGTRRAGPIPAPARRVETGPGRDKDLAVMDSPRTNRAGLDAVAA